jgi:hypothetical protein
MCTNFGHDNFLSHTVFTDEERFHTSGYIDCHNCFTSGSKPPREHLEHEQHSPNVNMWCVLKRERVTGQLFLGEDIITSNSFLEIWENYAPLQLNNPILLLDSVSVHFVHNVCNCLMLTDRKRWTNCVAPSFPWTYVFFFRAMWKTKCTVKEQIRWMNSRKGLLQQLHCYKGHVTVHLTRDVL